MVCTRQELALLIRSGRAGALIWPFHVGNAPQLGGPEVRPSHAEFWMRHVYLNVGSSEAILGRHDASTEVFHVEHWPDKRDLAGSALPVGE